MSSKQIVQRANWKEIVKKFQDKQYVFAKGTKINWFPGHMVKGLRQMQHSLQKTDCIIEVHDARVPMSGRNRNFKNSLTGNRPHILVLNKQDLAFGKYSQKRLPKGVECQKAHLKEQIMNREPQLSDVIFSNCSCRRIS